MTVSPVCFWFLVYIKTRPTLLTLQSCEADLSNFAQDLTAVSSLSIRAYSSLFYHFYLYQKGYVIITFWGLYVDATSLETWLGQ
jgi:hypothetical protein